MARTLDFDVYGNLIDPMSMTGPLRDMVGEQAGALSELWRETQLAYAFRRAAMRTYAARCLWCNKCYQRSSIKP